MYHGVMPMTWRNIFFIIIIVLANIIFITFRVQIIEAIVTYTHLALPHARISLEKSDVQFLLNKTNNWVDEKVVGKTNHDNVKLSYSIAEFTPPLLDLTRVVSVVMYPKNDPKMMIIDVNGSQLVNLPKRGYHGQILVYGDSIRNPVSTIVNIKLS
jgi:hypothetical protein